MRTHHTSVSVVQYKPYRFTATRRFVPIACAVCSVSIDYEDVTIMYPFM